MEASPFHHHHRCRRPFLSDQPLSFPNPTTAIEVISDLSNQTSIDNKLQSSDSCISMVVHDPHKVEKTNMPTTNSSSFNHHQTNETKSTCRKWKKEKRSNNDQENSKKKTRDIKEEEGQIGYIHVRARRGEATDSHSLAERARREKISEKMKALQAIVPGCDKITGKALMLDEVINYVQSLQNEIEVLSTKLASVSDRMSHELGADFDDGFMFKQYQNMTTNQQQMPSFQAHQMASMNSYGEILWNLDEQVERQELDDPFAIINTFDSFY